MVALELGPEVKEGLERHTVSQAVLVYAGEAMQSQSAFCLALPRLVTLTHALGVLGPSRASSICPQKLLWGPL